MTLMDQNDLHIGPLRFAPLYRTVRWGGTRLASFKNTADLPGDTIGESWEISGLEGQETQVAEGPLTGTKLSSVLRQYGERIMGSRLYERYGNDFPLLIKLIDAADDLSVQVHPDDAKAPDGRGKTELWYIIKADPGSYLYSGFNRPVDREGLTRAMNDNRLVDILAKHFPAPGDVFYIPAGRIHSIGAGNLLLEIQQASSTTYRLHDHNRLDQDGRPRQLHVDDALDVIDYSQTDFGLARPQLLINCETRVKRTPFFTVTAVQVMEDMEIDIASTDSPRVIVATSGKGTITDIHGNTARISRGQTILVPLESQKVTVSPTATPLRLITAYIE